MWIIAGHLTVKAWRARAGRGRTEAPTEDRVGTVTPRSTIRSKIVPWAVAGPSEVGESREPVELTRTFPQLREYAPLPRHWPGEAGRTSWPVSRTKIVPSSAQQ